MSKSCHDGRSDNGVVSSFGIVMCGGEVGGKVGGNGWTGGRGFDGMGETSSGRACRIWAMRTTSIFFIYHLRVSYKCKIHTKTTLMNSALVLIACEFEVIKV